ncbi:unnamed protein product [Trichobilharzia szidati]|nr:unnamed protein product [Trichobilharzia szidati]
MYIFENLNWDGKYDKHLISDGKNIVTTNIKDGDMKSLNSPISDKVRQGIPEKKLCSLFRGGSKCKYCDPPSHFDVSKMQIYGLYSTWQNALFHGSERRKLRNIPKDFIVTENGREVPFKPGQYPRNEAQTSSNRANEELNPVYSSQTTSNNEARNLQAELYTVVSSSNEGNSSANNPSHEHVQPEVDAQDDGYTDEEDFTRYVPYKKPVA